MNLLMLENFSHMIPYLGMLDARNEFLNAEITNLLRFICSCRFLMFSLI